MFGKKKLSKQGYKPIFIDRIFDISANDGELSKINPKSLELLSLDCIAA